MLSALFYISIFLLLLAAGYSVRYFRHFTPSMKWLAMFLITSALVEWLSFILPYIGIGNILIYQLYALSEGVFVFGIFSELDRYNRPISSALLLAWLGSTMAQTLLIHDQGVSLSRNALLVSIFQVALSLLYFKTLLRLPATKPLVMIPGFWFASSLIIYHAATFFRWTVFHLDVSHDISESWFMQLNLILMPLLIMIRLAALRLDLREGRRQANA